MLTSDRGGVVVELALIGVIVIPAAWMLLVVGRMAEGRVDKEAVRRWLCNELERRDEQRDENRSG